jgi:hypothetical protein
VTRGAAAYLAKYASKGGDVIREFTEDVGEDATPRQWWNLTKDARTAVKAQTLQGRTVGELLDSILGYAWNTSPDEVFRYVYHVEMLVDGTPINVGWRGCFWEEVYLDTRGMLKSAQC